MLSVGGLPVSAAPGNGHRRSRSDCGLNKRDAVADLAPLGGTRTPTGLRSHSPLPGGRHRHDVQRNAHTRPHTPVMMRSPSTSSIPEIFISGDDTDYPGMSPVTRLAVFSLADFIETVTPRKKGNSNEVGGGGGGGGRGGGSSRRRSPLSVRKSAAGALEVNSTPGAVNNVSAGAGGHGQATPLQPRATRLPNTHSQQEDGAAHSSNEDCDAETVPSSGVSNGSGELVETLRGGDVDDDEHSPHIQRTREALEHIQAKIQKTRDLIKEEQKARDENVNEYLKLAANADRQQLARIKAVFEKKNQKSATLIQQLQKKLENYQKRLREIETHGLVAAHRQPKEVLRDMGQGLKSVGGNIRDGITGFSGTVINKPKEIAHLIKNKFGSADNIKELAGEDDRDEDRAHHGSATLPAGASLIPPTSSNHGVDLHHHHNISANLSSHHQSSSAQGAGGSSSGGHQGSKIGSEEGSECNSSVTSESVPGGSTTLGHLTSPRNHHSQLTGVDFYTLPGGTSLEPLLLELRESREESARLREEIETIKQALAAEVNSMREGLAEERFRCDRLEEQVNDLTELHQNEMGNLVTNMADMEEKVQYQSEERIRDLHEIVENCHTRISRMEHQQAQQQQQYLTLEGLENSNARAVFVKLINVLLTVLQVLLLVVATVASILTPLMQTQTRIVVTTTVFFFLIFIYIQMPELKELWGMISERYKQLVTFK
ncbi:transmembrane and coiled-coil domains protein 1-like isoform X2 [Penaeus japonicus]|uniref:transmembrane and coiled-coil domains protein 1-like isoform X2 n=1 Tax=Penaeus japonicus TaxID=27405 RepID=UPI001C71382E|nr:transmembrane and coiled-coil domains protein 1-like isoform X2 [Penaeus japonicus]XP_042868354.1 transmembrane and coiled-coil domains protein 1-like isoform X2 [Penaeus japonicus]XP_042868439.1 transmembrane and coiled-coil domains protein 1-like isoform X2 [Penaeus japonicus]